MKLELKAIRLQRQNWIDAVNNSNMDGIGEILSEDAVWIPLGMPAINGRNQIMDWITPSFDGFTHEFKIENNYVKGAGNWAIEHADFFQKISPDEGGEATQHEGKYLVIWRWESDNVWRIERYLDNSDAPN